MIISYLAVMASLWLGLSTVVFRSPGQLMFFYIIISSLGAGIALISLISRWEKLAFLNIPMGVALVLSPIFIYHDSDALILNSLVVGAILVIQGLSLQRNRRLSVP